MTYCTDEDFALWAFGHNWKCYILTDCNEIDLMHAWNELHPDNPLTEDGIIQNDMKWMKELWEKSKGNNK